jgi:ribosomal protein S4
MQFLVSEMVRAGAPSRAWSRRIISSRMVMVNGVLCKDISATVKPGDIITFFNTTWTVE